MRRRTELQDLLIEIGINRLTELVKGCGQLAMLINELPPTERMRLHARMNEVLSERENVLPFAGKFLVEVVSRGVIQPHNAYETEHGVALGKEPH